MCCFSFVFKCTRTWCAAAACWLLVVAGDGSPPSLATRRGAGACSETESAGYVISYARTIKRLGPLMRGTRAKPAHGAVRHAFAKSFRARVLLPLRSCLLVLWWARARADAQPPPVCPVCPRAGHVAWHGLAGWPLEVWPGAGRRAHAGDRQAACDLRCRCGRGHVHLFDNAGRVVDV